MDCVFCKLINDEIPSKKLYEDDKILAFYDINPQAAVHFLVIPKKHIDSAAMINAENQEIAGHIFTAIAKICAKLEITNGYRVVTNVGEDGRQTVHHMHFHVLAGEKLEMKLN